MTHFAPMAPLSAVSKDTVVAGAFEAGGVGFGVAIGALPWRLFEVSAILAQVCSGYLCYLMACQRPIVRAKTCLSKLVRSRSLRKVIG